MARTSSVGTVLKGNRGEWGVIYALCYLLGTGRIDITNDHLSAKAGEGSKIIDVVRSESPSDVLCYSLDEQNETVRITGNSMHIDCVSQNDFMEVAYTIFDAIKINGGRSFSIPEVNQFLYSIGCHKLKPTVDVRPSLEVHILDPCTLVRRKMLFNVKCMAGARPTLANASGLTYIYYKVEGLDQHDYSDIAGIPQGKVKERVVACQRLAKSIEYQGLSEDAMEFRHNLRTVHPYAEKAIAYMVLESYAVRGRHSRIVLERVRQINPLGIRDTSIYTEAYREYLWAVFCGMVPSTPWSNHTWFDGLLLIDVVGNVFAFPTDDITTFKNHLLDATLLETPSTKANRSTAHTGEVISIDGDYRLTLNIQIRYDADIAKPVNKIRPICVRFTD